MSSSYNEGEGDDEQVARRRSLENDGVNGKEEEMDEMEDRVDRRMDAAKTL